VSFIVIILLTNIHDNNIIRHYFTIGNEESWSLFRAHFPLLSDWFAAQNKIEMSRELKSSIGSSESSRNVSDLRYPLGSPLTVGFIAVLTGLLSKSGEESPLLKSVTVLGSFDCMGSQMRNGLDYAMQLLKRIVPLNDAEEEKTRIISSIPRLWKAVLQES
jgi:hypothetical protein